MSDCGGACLFDNGSAPGGGGSSLEELTFDTTTTDAVPLATGLVSLPANGAHALFADITLQTVNETAGLEGQGAGAWWLASLTALRNAADGSIVIAAPQQGAAVAPSVLWAIPLPPGLGGAALGYGPGPVFGAPLVPAPVLAIVANVVTLTIAGIAATTLRWHLRARVWAFDGAVRLI